MKEIIPLSGKFDDCKGFIREKIYEIIGIDESKDLQEKGLIRERSILMRIRVYETKDWWKKDRLEKALMTLRLYQSKD